MHSCKARRARLSSSKTRCRASEGLRRISRHPAVKKQLGVKKTRFATPEELTELTGLVPGSVPPFGEPVLPFELYVDEALRANDRIAFNAGSLTDSIVMPIEHYKRLTRAESFTFAALA